MKITVKLFATFRVGRFKEDVRDYPPGTECCQVAEDLGISPDALGVILVNGRHAPVDRPLEEGDTLSLFPLVGGG